MARNIKRGLDYTFLPTDFFSDLKIQRLIKRTGNPAAPCVYLAFLCLVYKEGYYCEYDDDLLFIVSNMTQVPEDDVDTIFKAALALNLFSEEMLEVNHIVTSHGIQQHYNKACSESKKKARVAEFSLLDSRDETTEEMAINSNFLGRNVPNGKNLEVFPCISTEEMGINTEEMAISTEEMGINTEEMAISTEEMQQSKSKVKEKRKKNSFSSFPSFSLNEEEQEKQEIIFNFFFTRKFLHPVNEYERMILWNNSPVQGRIPWTQQTAEQHRSCAEQWKSEEQKSNSTRKRFSADAYKLWLEVVNSMIDLNAPADVILSSLGDSLKIQTRDNSLEIGGFSHDVMEFLEQNLDVFKPIIYNHMKKYGCTKLIYTDILDSGGTEEG